MTQTHTEAGELMPCPFCGKQPFDRWEDNPNGPKYPGHHFVWCENLDCHCGGEAMEETKEAAFAAWNTRAPVQAATRPATSEVVAESRFTTEMDRQYASELLADLANADEPRLEVATQWFRKARVENSLLRNAAPPVSPSPEVRQSECIKRAGSSACSAVCPECQMGPCKEIDDEAYGNREPASDPVPAVRGYGIRSSVQGTGQLALGVSPSPVAAERFRDDRTVALKGHEVIGLCSMASIVAMNHDVTKEEKLDLASRASKLNRETVALMNAAISRPVEASPDTVKVLEEIARNKYGLQALREADASIEEIRDYFAKRCIEYEGLARTALAQIRKEKDV